MDNQSTRKLRAIVCDINGDPVLLAQDVLWVSSPIDCLDHAVDRYPQMLVVCIGRVTIQERYSLVRLCSALKRNRHTRDIPLLALLHSRHRKVIKDLEQVCVDYVRIVPDVQLVLKQLIEVMDNLGAADRLQSQLEGICPFLHYTALDSRNEMAVCGAYLDRMVLGGHRLMEICETGKHLCCEYYLNPRTAS